MFETCASDASLNAVSPTRSLARSAFDDPWVMGELLGCGIGWPDLAGCVRAMRQSQRGGRRPCETARQEGEANEGRGIEAEG